LAEFADINACNTLTTLKSASVNSYFSMAHIIFSQDNCPGSTFPSVQSVRMPRSLSKGHTHSFPTIATDTRSHEVTSASVICALSQTNASSILREAPYDISNVPEIETCSHCKQMQIWDSKISDRFRSNPETKHTLDSQAPLSTGPQGGNSQAPTQTLS
jgi:hypothetical protein